MNAKTISIIAVIIGSLCAAIALWEQHVMLSIATTVPFAAGGINNRYFWWPLYASIAFLAVAFVGFVLRMRAL